MIASVDIKIMMWNTRGFTNPKKRMLVRRVIKKCKCLRVALKTHMAVGREQMVKIYWVTIKLGSSFLYTQEMAGE